MAKIRRRKSWKGRITERRAGILGYLAQTTRCSHGAIALKNKDRQGLAADNLQSASQDSERALGDRQWYLADQ
jgi:hypothetical protein